MTKLMITVAALAALALPAKAETVDVSTLKCSELMAMNQDEIGSMLLWLHGYYGGQANDTTIDLSAFEPMGTAIGEKCAAEPELGVMTAIKQITEAQ
jgi:acid stress chaperone HdeB